MKRLYSEPKFNMKLPLKRIKRIIDSGSVHDYGTINLEFFEVIGESCFYNEKIDDDFVPVKIKEISFEGINYNGGKISYTIFGEEIDNPNYEEQLKLYNDRKRIYEEDLILWNKQKADDAEQKLLSEKKREFDIYMKLKKIYESQSPTN